MSNLELLLNENKGKILQFENWYIQHSHLYYKYNKNIYSILEILGDDEITFFMSNGLTFELKLINNIIQFRGMSVHGKSISIEYETYQWS